MITWIQKLIYRILGMSAIFNGFLEMVKTLNEQFKVLESRMDTVETGNPPWIFFNSKLAVTINGDKAFVDYQFAEIADAAVGIRSLVASKSMLQETRINSIKLIGNRYAITNVRIANMEVFEGQWPANKEWEIPETFREINVGSRITVHVTRVLHVQS